MSGTPGHTEKLLIRAQKGDRSAIQEIYSMYYDRLNRYGASMGYGTDAIHDCIQDLFVWFILNPDKLGKIKNLDVYLFQSLKRNINSSLKREKGKRDSALKYLSTQEETSNVESRLIASEIQEDQLKWLTSRLNCLSPHQKEIVYLRFYENLSYDEIAELQSVSNQVVRNSVFRALKKLRKSTAEEDPTSLKGLFYLLSVLALGL